MRKKSISLLVVLLVLPFVFSLNSCDPYDCGDTGSGKYLIEKLQIQLLEKINLDQESHDYIELAANSTIEYRKLAISIFAESTRSALNKNSKSAFGFSTAFACSPVYNPVDTIQSIKIYASRNAEQEEVTDKFLVYLGSSDTTIEDYLASEPLFADPLMMSLVEPPTELGEYSFQVHIILTGGELEEVNLVTETVNLELSESN